MNDQPATRFRARPKLLLAALAALALSLGAVSIAEASSDEEVDGVDCVDGIDAATGAECDGGPAANPTDDSAEEDTEAAG